MNKRKLWALFVAPALAATGLLLAFLLLGQITVGAAPEAQSANAITLFQKSVDASFGVAGERRTYQIVFSSTQDVAMAQLTDPLPSMVTWAGDLSWTSGDASYSNGTLTWSGPLTTDVPVTISYGVTVNEGPYTDVYTDVHNYALLDDGQGNVYSSTPAIFAIGRPFGTGSDRTFAIDFGDADNNGDLDLAVGNHGPNQVCWNNGDGSFSCEDAFGGSATFDVEWGDMDGDGYLDLVVANSMAHANLVCLNNRDRSFTCRPFSTCQDPHGGDEVCHVALGDVNRDGNTDIALGTFYPDTLFTPDVIYYNDGNATFPITTTTCRDLPTLELAFGHIDKDEDLDLVAVGLYADYVCINHSGTFTESCQFAGGHSRMTWSVALGDTNDDSQVDLIATGENSPYRNSVYLNDGGCPFTRGLYFGPDSGWQRTYSLAWGDVDNDGDLDLAAGYHYRQTVVYFNEPVATTPGFTLTRPLVLGVGAHRTNSVAFGDADDDGDLDLAVGSDRGQNIVYLNRVLAPPPPTPEPPDESGPPIPEPTTLTLLGLGLSGLAGYMGRQHWANRKALGE